MSPYKIRIRSAKKAATALHNLPRGQLLLRPSSGKAITRRPTIINTNAMTGLVEHGLVEEAEDGCSSPNRGARPCWVPCSLGETDRHGRAQNSLSGAGLERRHQWC